MTVVIKNGVKRIIDDGRPRTKFKVNNWEVTEEGKEFEGLYESGMVNIPEGEFTDEQMQAWIKEGKLIPFE